MLWNIKLHLSGPKMCIYQVIALLPDNTVVPLLFPVTSRSIGSSVNHASCV